MFFFFFFLNREIMELIDRSLGCDNDDDDNNIKQSSMIWEKYKK